MRLISAFMFVALLGWGTGAVGACLSPPGDVTADGKTNIADAQCVMLVSVWTAGGSAGAAPGCLATELSSTDITCEGTTDVGDVQALVRYILDGALFAALDGNANGCSDACEGLEIGRVVAPPVVFTGSAAAEGIQVDSLTPWAAMPGAVGGIFSGNTVRTEVVPAASVSE